jgi:hypothetical protein
MKVNLVYGSAGEHLDNYLNINPYGEAAEDTVVSGVQTLDEHVDNGECEEIVACNVLEYIPTPNIASTLANWVSKLRVGGTLTLSFVDAHLLAKEFGRYAIALQDYNEELHGKQDKPYMIKRSAVTLTGILDHMVASHTVKVVTKRYNNKLATVIFERE